VRGGLLLFGGCYLGRCLRRTTRFGFDLLDELGMAYRRRFGGGVADFTAWTPIGAFDSVDAHHATPADATALQAHVQQLPKDIQLKAADVMRLATAYGPNGGALKFEQFCDSLTPSQFETFHKWWRGLSRGDQDNILGAISK